MCVDSVLCLADVGIARYFKSCGVCAMRASPSSLDSRHSSPFYSKQLFCSKDGAEHLKNVPHRDASLSSTFKPKSDNIFRSSVAAFFSLSPHSSGAQSLNNFLWMVEMLRLVSHLSGSVTDLQKDAA